MSIDEWASVKPTGVINPPAGVYELLMNNDIKLEWCDALEGGAYTQGFSRLRSFTDEYCPLGVLCDIASKHKVIAWEKMRKVDHYIIHGYSNTLPFVVREWAGIKTGSDTDRRRHDGQDVPLHWGGDWHPIWRLNDTYKLPFPLLGQMIRMQY